MKTKDSLIYGVFVLSFALLICLHAFLNSAFAPGSPVTELVHTLLMYADHFVNSNAFVTTF